MEYRRYILSIALAFCIATPAMAQSRWEPIGNINFRDAYNFGGGNVVIAASSGSLYWTSDDGTTFQTQPLDDSSGLNSIQFQGTFGVAGSDSNRVFLSTDGGTTWAKKYLPSRYGINYVTLVGADTLFACGNRSTILRSTNRGEAWTLQSAPGSITLYRITVATSKKLFINADSGFLYSTTDGGLDWNREYLPFIARGPVGSFAISLDGEYLAAGGDSSLNMKTATPCVGVSTDSGATWKVGILNAHIGAPIYARFLGGDTIVAFQSDFFRYVSTDNGISWDSIDLRANESATQIGNYSGAWLSATANLMVCGDNGTVLDIPDPLKPGILLHTYGRGMYSTWFEGMRGNPNVIHGIGSDDFAYSTDGGASWETHSDPNLDQSSYIGLHFSDDSSGVVLTLEANTKTYYPPNSTSNNGASWQRLSPAQCPHQAWFYNTIGKNGALFITSDTGIEYSTDNGLDWTRWGGYREEYDTNAGVTSFEIHDAAFFGMDTAYLHVHSNGGNWPSDVFLATYNHGTTWNRTVFSVGYPFSMAFISPMVGMFSLDGGSIYRTSDGGATWNQIQIAPNTLSLRAVCFNRDGALGLVCGDSGFVAYTLDSGQTWQSERVSMFGGKLNYDLSKVFAISDTTFMIQGSYSLYRKTYHIQGPPSTVNPALAQYLFLQTYPNPASGQLNCRLTGLDNNPNGWLNAELFDLMGRKVMGLTDAANQGKSGNFSDFDVEVSSLPAGVYIVHYSLGEYSYGKPVVIIH